MYSTMTITTSVTRIFILLCLIAPLLVSATANVDTPSKLQPRKPQFSRRMGQRSQGKGKDASKKKDYSQFLCPGGSVACPVPPESKEEITPEYIENLSSNLNSLGDWFKVGFECIELDEELNSCGGCLALGAGQDCSTIANARGTGCQSGVCQVYSCFEGYVVSPDRKECVKKGSTVPATPITAHGQVVLEEKLE